MIEKAKDSILVCISDAKSNSLVIKKANEIAIKENARLIALYVCDRNDYQKKQEKGFLQQNLDLAESIGAMIEIIYDDDIAAQIVNFAKLYRVKKIVLGRNNNQRNFFILNKSICVVFPAAILQPPFFSPSAPDAANYGAIGAVIGHEIGHGFDDQGCEYDGDGVLNNWWTEEDKTNFTERTKALIEQYNAFTPTQLIVKYSHLKSKEERNAMPHVNGALTIGENIGDLSGVTIALKAYAFALQKSNGQEIDGSDDAIRETLLNAPKVDGFTALQRFFLSYALVWRSKSRNEIAEQYLQIDPHSPAECRTNGIARNVDLFYNAFDVKEGDEMWLDPSERVHIW